MQRLHASIICILAPLSLCSESGSTTNARNILPADCTQCPKIQQWTAKTNFLCGPSTGLGCEFVKYEDAGGLPLTMTFYNDDVNGSKYIPCNTVTSVVPMTDSGTITKQTFVNCTVAKGKKIKVKVMSPCHQKKSSFEYGVESEEIVVECGAPSSDGQSMHVKVATDFYKFGEDLSAHVRAVLNVHSATCEFFSTSQEGILEISSSERIGRGVMSFLVYSVVMMLGGIMILDA